MTIGLTLKISIVGMDQTQNEERMDQEVEAERGCRKEPQRPSFVE